MKIDKDAVRFTAGIEAYRKRLPDISKDGKRFKARCPLHADSHPSLSVDLKDGVYLWHCFPCNAGGDIFALVQKMDNCDFADAVKAVANDAGKLDPAKPISQHKPTPKRIFDRRKAERDLKKYQTALAVQIEAWKADPFIDDPDVPAVSFLRKRGVSFEVAKDLGFGYSQWNNALAMPSYGQDVKTGLRDELIGIKFRSVEDHPKYKWTCVEASESDILYGVGLRSITGNGPIEHLTTCFAFESQLDVALVRSLGFNAVALHNRIVPDPDESNRFELDLFSLSHNYIRCILVGDNDSAGRDAMAGFAEAIGEGRTPRTYGRPLPEGFKDIGDMHAADPVDAMQWLKDTLLEVIEEYRTPQFRIPPVAETGAANV
ncbi:MAG: hypothetical protein BGO25_02670 [Acidobacteriales bacterium 59-55]|nr:hypothetical protein [Terriglobales bacterium]OJV42423.1 MAG: hypothetical protein BGO25_02670 [Acidobacteriales bacterium 59-55]